MKVLADYDPTTGNISVAGYWANIGINLPLPEAKEVDKLDAILKLKAEGFSVEEIVQLKREGLV